MEGEKENEWVLEHIIFESFNSIYCQHGSHLTWQTVKSEPQKRRGSDNVNETDYMLKRDMNGE